MRTIFLHGSDKADRILAEGFKLDVERKHDAGDFGYGIYLTPHRAIAKCHGKVVRVVVDTAGFAHIENPYFLDSRTGTNIKPVTEHEKMFHQLAFKGTDMRTVRGEDRMQVAKSIRKAFMAKGHKGLTTGHRGETVVFDLSAIQFVTATNKSK